VSDAAALGTQARAYAGWLASGRVYPAPAVADDDTFDPLPPLPPALALAHVEVFVGSERIGARLRAAKRPTVLELVAIPPEQIEVEAPAIAIPFEPLPAHQPLILPDEHIDVLEAAPPVIDVVVEPVHEPPMEAIEPVVLAEHEIQPEELSDSPGNATPGPDPKRPSAFAAQRVTAPPASS